MSLPHKTIPVKVWADVDEKIADAVIICNALPGIRTHASCQGTIGEGGPNPYPPQVLVSWESPEARAELERHFGPVDMTDFAEESCHGYIHPYLPGQA